MSSDQQKQQRRKPNILLGITGSVAAVKGPELALLLHYNLKANVIVVTTKTGQFFWDHSSQYNPSCFQDVKDVTILGKDILMNDISILNSTDDATNTNNTYCEGNNPSLFSLLEHFTSDKIILFESNDEWIQWNKIGDPVLHIILRDWADIALLAPLSANTLAKISSGLCNDTLSCCMRAWNFGGKGKPIVVAPAMNTGMWNHVLTNEQLEKIGSFFVSDKDDKNNNASSMFTIIHPQKNKTLACGEVGSGAMADLKTILETVESCIEKFIS